jgi:hypothetical protein
VETPLALPVNIPDIVNGGEEPLSFALAPPTGMPETFRGRSPWWDRPLLLAVNFWALTRPYNRHVNPSPHNQRSIQDWHDSRTEVRVELALRSK